MLLDVLSLMVFLMPCHILIENNMLIFTPLPVKEESKLNLMLLILPLLEKTLKIYLLKLFGVTIKE
jgi:hypothetical protein